MSSSNISSLQLEANNLNYISMMFIRCFCYVVIPLGLIGHCMNIYVLTRRALRTNPCSRYFLAASIVGLMVTCYNLPMRMIQSGYTNIDPGGYSIVFCKITWLFLNSLRNLCPWLIVLAGVDRYCCSSISATMRAWSSLRVANRVIPVTILFGLIIYIHVPFFYRIDVIPVIQKRICYPSGPAGTYRIVLSFFNLVYFGLAPSCCMLFFGVLTLRNIARSKRVGVNPQTNLETRQNKNKRKTDRQLLLMLFVQVLVYCVTSLAFAIAFIVTSISSNLPKNVFQIAQENLMTAIGGMLSNTGPCLSFYLFSFSSTLFMKEVKKLFCKPNPMANNQFQLTHVQSLNTNRTRMKTNT